MITINLKTALKNLERNNPYEIYLFTSDYGCNDCEIIEYVLATSHLDDFIDYRVVVSQNEDDLELAEKHNIMIPMIIIKQRDKKIVIDDFDPRSLVLSFRDHILQLIKLYSELDRLYEDHRAQLEKILGKKVSINRKVIAQIAKNMIRYGKPVCPCKPSELCPCKDHINELKKYGRCKCGLFTLKLY